VAVHWRFYLNALAAALVSYTGASAATEVPQTNQYETPGPVNAQDFLPKSAFSGKKIFVEKIAQNDGLQNTYRIRAGGEEYEIKGSAAAMEVLQEIRAIHQLRQISTTKALTQGLKESAKGTYQTGKEIVRDPGGALKKVPEGASKFFGKVKGFFGDDEEDASQGASPGETVKGILGVDKAKRKLAARLGVDVYSRNQVLQDELDRVASATAGGGVAFDIGTLPIGGAVGIGLTVIGVQQTVDSLVNESFPISLRNWNEENLIKLGANQDLVFQFINHPWYTLRQITVITTSLVTTKVNPDLFLESANKALTPADGRYFEQVAELLAVYSEKTAPLQSLRLQDGLLCAIDTNGVLIVPVSLDYAIWTAKVAQRVDDLAHLPVDEPTLKGVQVCIDGKASERVKSELSKRKIGYQSLFGVME
jgi:hypothetical protein